MPIHDREVLKALEQANKPLGIRELLKQGGFHPGQQTDLKRALRDLVRSGRIDKLGKRFILPGGPPAPTQAPVPEAVPRVKRAGARETAGPERRPRGTERAAPGRERRFAGREGGAPERRPRPVERGAPQRERRLPAGRAAERRPARPEGEGLVDGILHVHRDGFGFVHPLTGGGENIYIPWEEAQLALDGDRVLVEVVAGRGGRSSGVVLDVLERRRQRVVGVYRQEGRRAAWVTPNDKSLPGDIRVPPTQLARNGDLVKVVLGIGASVLEPGVSLFGEVMGVIGQPGSPSGEVLSVAYANGFSDEFPEEVMTEADRYPIAVTPEEAIDEERRDLRHLPLVTIDGEDARDFDDAVFVEPKAGGWRLVVAIADVTHYVRQGMALDAEALHRATSVYLPDRVLPMLPERLSNGICSLRPDEDRLCMVADMQFDRGARLSSYELYPGVMRSAARCTYNEVQDVLDGKDVPHRNRFRPQFENLMALARALGQMRRQRGAIDFDLPEYKVIIGDDGLPVRMERRERKDSHRLIEECMLAANEAVARFFQENELPSVYRFHGEPDEEKLQIFAALAQAHGFKLGTRGEISSRELNEFLEQLEGHPERRALNQLLLRSMMQAVYSAENVGHYGLAAEYYLHFTSPIRRYPDLIVHRLLKAHWRSGGKVPPLHQREAETERLEAMAVQSSERERAAVSVEREVVAFYSTLLMKDRVGEEFDGTVGAIADFGFFVELEGVFVEGLVRAETLGPGMRLDTLSHSLVWPHGKRVRVGDKARVRLVAANLDRRQLELEALSFPGEAALERPAAGRMFVRQRRAAPPREEPQPTERRAPGRQRRAAPPREEARPTERRSKAPARRAETPREEPRRRAEPPQREVRTERPASGRQRAPVPLEEAPSSSPHPGFDRLRALASQKGKGRGGGGGKGSRRR